MIDLEEVPSPNPMVETAEASAKITETFIQISRWWAANQRKVFEVVGWAASSLHFAEKLERTGWLPHYTTPDLTFQLDDEGTDAQIARHYEDNWEAVESAFLARLVGYAIDEEAKACFREALQAHGMGLYRVAPRLLFPEIERLFRAEFGDGIEVTAGLRHLRDASGQLGGETFVRTGVLTLRLYQAFIEWIYVSIKTEEALARAVADPVPNRHAAIHGLVVYNTQKASLNALIIAEFVLLTVGAVHSAAMRGEDNVEFKIDAGSTGDLGYPHIAGNRNWLRLDGSFGDDDKGCPA